MKYLSKFRDSVKSVDQHQIFLLAGVGFSAGAAISWSISYGLGLRSAPSGFISVIAAWAVVAWSLTALSWFYKVRDAKHERMADAEHEGMVKMANAVMNELKDRGYEAEVKDGSDTDR